MARIGTVGGGLLGNEPVNYPMPSLGSTAGAGGGSLPQVDYKALILAESGLIHYWPMDDAAGTTVADAVGGGFTGTASVSGFPGRSLVNDGKTARRLAFGCDINFGAHNLPSPPFTIEFWSLVLTGSNCAFFGNWDGTNGIMFYMTGNAFRHYANTSFQPGTAFLYDPGFINYIVGVWNGANSKIYINSVLVSTHSLPSPTNSGDFWEIGGYANNGGSTWAGIIQHVAMYNLELSAGQISTHYNAGKGAPYSS